jgi:hypothetical protein
MLSFTKKEKALLKKLNTPAKVQDFLNGIKFNFEKPARLGGTGETLKSPVMVLRQGTKKSVHCMEGALFGAYILSLHGFIPYVLCLKSAKGDYDHVVTPFKVWGLWGALSKTNHAVLRYREPIYKNVRELSMSYFHEYFLNNGKKTLRTYSELFNLNTLPDNWFLSEKDLWYIDKKLDKIKYYDIVPRSYIKNLRKADKVEILAGKIVEWKK